MKHVTVSNVRPAPQDRASRGPLTTRSFAAAGLKQLITVSVLAVALVLLFAQTGGRAAAGDALPYSKGFLVTGNYVVGGVDLIEAVNPIQDGFSTGTIQMGDVVPANADIIAAYLFWETITLTSDPSQAAGVKFRGADIDITSVLRVEKHSAPLTGSTTPCWSSGVPLSMHMFRADVLKFLPMQLDMNNRPTGKRLVNDSDLVAHALPPHTVTLPVRDGNEIPESAGATLFVVFRDTTQPLRKIVIYDGIFVKPSLDAAMQQSIQGFYKSATVKSAQMTHIVASGQPNQNDTISFNNQVIASNPFTAGSASQRGWANKTYDVTSYMNPGSNSSGGYGETVTTRVYHQPSNGGTDCLTWGAVVFSTAVADVDNDGLPDGLEDSQSVLKDPDEKVLPNLKAMGAGSDQQDLFVEVNAMWAEPGTSYGSPTAPVNSTAINGTVTDENGHHHVPTPEVLKMVGDAYAARNIRAHFDVGNVTDYHNRGVVQHTDWVDDYTSTEADQYLVGNGIGSNLATLARGGEVIKETACDPTKPSCHFPDYPGTVGWRLGLPFHRDWPVGDAGQEISFNPADPNYFDWNAGTKRIRFDAARGGLFHYVLYPHARAKPKSLPCLVNGQPAAYDLNNGTSCTTNNPDFIPLDYHVPSSTSGVADLPGGNAMVTLGLWEEFVARPFVRASTTLHELGHNLELWHGGLPPIVGNKALNTATYVEPNCKPNHLSSMSYLFQVHGLFDDNDDLNIDFSGTAYGGINETTTLTDTALSPTPAYQQAWFAPAGSALASMLAVAPATRFCSGTKFNPAAPPAPTARVHAASTVAPIDWNGDTIINSVPFQDVNFDGTLTGATNLLNGFDDWAHIRLDQIGAAPTGFGEGLAAEFAGLVAEFGGLAAEFAGTNEGLAAEFAGLAAEFGGLAAEFAGLDEGLAAEFGGLAAEFAGIAEGLAAEFAGLAAEFAGIDAGLAAEFAGLAAEFGGLAAEFAGLDEGLAAEFGGLAAEFAGQDLSYDDANGLGKSRPSGLKLCNLGVPGCEDASPFTPEYHRVFGRFNPIPFGTGVYEVQRKREGAPDSTFVPVVTTPSNEFTDYTELANGFTYVYRVRLLAADGNSGWSRYQTVTAVNDAPAAAPDGPAPPYAVDNRSTLNVGASSGVLANDLDHDSPTAYRGRRAFLVSGPTAGTLTCGGADPAPLPAAICATGAFRYVPPKGGSFVGLVTFTYKADDGLSSDNPPLPLSGFSQTVTVTINVYKK